MQQRFDVELHAELQGLRERLLRDVEAAASGEPMRGGIRGEWRQMVRRLAFLRNSTNSQRARYVQAPAQPEA